jgi:hypothetical protein
MKFNIATSGLIATVFLMALAIPYTVYSYFDTSIPFDQELVFYSAVSIILFGINLYYYKRSKRENS